MGWDTAKEKWIKIARGVSVQASIADNELFTPNFRVYIKKKVYVKKTFGKPHVKKVTIGFDHMTRHNAWSWASVTAATGRPGVVNCRGLTDEQVWDVMINYAVMCRANKQTDGPTLTDWILDFLLEPRNPHTPTSFDEFFTEKLEQQLYKGEDSHPALQGLDAAERADTLQYMTENLTANLETSWDVFETLLAHKTSDGSEILVNSTTSKNPPQTPMHNANRSLARSATTGARVCFFLPTYSFCLCVNAYSAQQVEAWQKQEAERRDSAVFCE